MYAIDEACVEIDEKSAWNDVEEDRPAQPADANYLCGKILLNPVQLLTVVVLGHDAPLHEYRDCG